MLLHGDNWCARFDSATLHQGTVNLVGSFSADWPGLISTEAKMVGRVTDRDTALDYRGIELTVKGSTGAPPRLSN